jgi:hypothetical protein
LELLAIETSDFLLLLLSGQVSSPEHNNDIKGETLDLIKYIDNNFDG